MKCKTPSKKFYLKYFPRNEWSFDVDDRMLKFGIGIRLHVITACLNRKPYVLVYDDTLEWSFAVDIDMKLYKYKNYLSEDDLKVLLYKLRLNRDMIISAWNDRDTDEIEWCSHLNQ
jgi:hypothetical protein